MEQVTFIQLEIAASLLYHADDGSGVTETALHTAASLFRDDTEAAKRFHSLIQDDHSPIEVLLIMADEVKDRMMGRRAFLEQVSVEADFGDYAELEREYRRKVEGEYVNTVKVINGEHLFEEEPIEETMIYAHQVFEIIEESVRDAVNMIQEHRVDSRGEDHDELLIFILNVLEAWRAAFFKRIPNKLTSAFGEMIRNADILIYDGGPKPILRSLSSALFSMALCKDCDLRDIFIVEIADAVKGDLRLTRTLCAVKGIMDKRTFAKRIQTDFVKSELDNITLNEQLRITL